MTALFRSTHDALRFAYNYSGLAVAQTRYGSVPNHDGKGLGGYDGAAESGHIQQVVSEAGKLLESLVIAKYAPPTHPRWQDAVAYAALAVSDDALPHVDIRLTGAYVTVYYARLDLQDAALARILGIHRSTVGIHRKKVHAYLRGTRHQQGMDALAYETVDRLLTDRGIVGNTDV